MTNVSAIAVGIPERLKEAVGAVPGIVVLDDLVTAAGVLEDWPDAHIIYGENLFGPAVTGQGVLLLPEQAEKKQLERVWVVVDISPPDLPSLPFDDPRLLAPHAAMRLRAARLIDVSTDGWSEALGRKLNSPVDTPPE